MNNKKVTPFSELGTRLLNLADVYELSDEDAEALADAATALDAVGMPRVMNERQLAAVLGVTPLTLRKWRAELGLPFMKLSRNVVRFTSDSVLEWLADFEERTA